MADNQGHGRSDHLDRPNRLGLQSLSGWAFKGKKNNHRALVLDSRHQCLPKENTSKT